MPAGEASRIYVFLGPRPGEAAEYRRHRLSPMLNDLGQIETWRAEPGRGAAQSAVLHIDTGMSRLGLPPAEVARLAAEPERLAGLDIDFLMSHMACAEAPEHPMNQAQLSEFKAALGPLGGVAATPRASLANSSAIFLGGQYHFDLARPGAALYGLNPTPGKANPMAETVRLQAEILQVREIDSPRSIGYGATHRVKRPSRIATVPVGYADGYLRSASNRASVHIAGLPAPLVGRVSMDMITLDVTDIPAQHAQPGAPVDLIGGGHPVDALAAEAGTIGYEILTSLGMRYRRRYIQNGSERQGTT